MKKIAFAFLGFSFHIALAQQPEILIAPYLQDASPSSIKIMWETSSGEESIVEYGTTSKLSKKATGAAYPINYTDSRIHEVQLTGLSRLTTYYYRVKTGKMVSDTYQFKTPPFASDKKAFRVVAMSDMQEDRTYPDKFAELINDGVLSYLQKEYGGKVPDNLALMMIPGDLVDDGTNYEQWKRDFFDPGSPLFSQVPVYPVPGNHERNSAYYFKYFSLPSNGSPEYDEHWWYKDYGNTRIIGINSNDGYRINKQLEWLDNVLEKTSANDSIDLFLPKCTTHSSRNCGWMVKKTLLARWWLSWKNLAAIPASPAFTSSDTPMPIPEGSRKITNTCGSMWRQQVAISTTGASLRKETMMSSQLATTSTAL
jgi:acid phosphatase type 7